MRFGVCLALCLPDPQTDSMVFLQAIQWCVEDSKLLQKSPYLTNFLMNSFREEGRHSQPIARLLTVSCHCPTREPTNRTELPKATEHFQKCPMASQNAKKKRARASSNLLLQERSSVRLFYVLHLLTLRSLLSWLLVVVQAVLQSHYSEIVPAVHCTSPHPSTFRPSSTASTTSDLHELVAVSSVFAVLASFRPVSSQHPHPARRLCISDPDIRK